MHNSTWMRSGLVCLDQGVCLVSVMFMFGTRATVYLYSGNQKTVYLYSGNQKTVYLYSGNQKIVYLFSGNQKIVYLYSGNQKTVTESSYFVFLPFMNSSRNFCNLHFL